MGMSGEEYLQSLRDGRRVSYRGEFVDVTFHPKFSVVQEIARGYDRALERALAGTPARTRTFPQSTQDLRDEMYEMDFLDMSERTTRLSLLGLHTAAGRMSQDFPAYGKRIESFVEDCDRNDLRVVPAITDAKGDRSVGPMKQIDPDSYLRVIDQRADGVIIRGAKLHVTDAAVTHELLVMPTKQMKPGEESWSIACAVPANAPGVVIMTAVPGAEYAEKEYFPYSSKPQHPYCFLVFDDVFVPWERVFLCGETGPTGGFAHSLGLWLRLDTAALQSDESDMLVGLAQLLAEVNGIEKMPHVRDKIAELILDATVVRAGFEAALSAAKMSADGYVAPDELYTNMAKYFATVNMPKAYAIVQDIAGGSILTAPMPEDMFESPTAEYLAKYMKASANHSGEYRMRLFHAARDLAADANAGRRQVTYMHGAGGLFAQKLVARRNYDMGRAKRLAIEATGLREDSGTEA